ncbi:MULTISPECIES: chemotaxis protein CheW [Anaeromyxobacter]|uniref:chemotaxis protein CheW n=1 Tax=Anaeromyxobacter TaxID=161492 RepID=UPI001F58A618|nr:MULTISPECIES: chemotaxis protein CheW [unclassified Anaeromyxobacter]
MRHVLFRLGRERFALPLEAVREVVLPQPPFARVPRASEAVRGVMNLRGRVIAVVDLAPLVGLAAQALEPSAGQVIVLDHARRALGLLIGGVLGVEPLTPEGRGGEGLVRGVATSRAGAVTVLGADAVASEAVRLFGGR